MRHFPFKDIVTERPYPPTGLNSARWVTEVPVLWVFFRQLILTQSGVRIAPLFGLSDPDRVHDAYPHVVAWDGQFYLENGHHRVVRRAITTKYLGMDMRVFRAEVEAQP